MKYTALQNFFFQITCLVFFIITGCNKVADSKTVNNSLERKSEIHTDSFIYELNIYDARGRLSVYKLTSSKPLTQLDSSNFMEESLKDERGNRNP